MEQSGEGLNVGGTSVTNHYITQAGGRSKKQDSGFRLWTGAGEALPLLKDKHHPKMTAKIIVK